MYNDIIIFTTILIYSSSCIYLYITYYYYYFPYYNIHTQTYHPTHRLCTMMIYTLSIVLLLVLMIIKLLFFIYMMYLYVGTFLYIHRIIYSLRSNIIPVCVCIYLWILCVCEKLREGGGGNYSIFLWYIWCILMYLWYHKNNYSYTFLLHLIIFTFLYFTTTRSHPTWFLLYVYFNILCYTIIE